jgi:hypothetical protein
MAKFSGLYQLPWGLSVSGTLVANQGNPVMDGRSNISGVTLYPKDKKYGDLRTPNVYQVNLALEKVFKLSDNVDMACQARVYNALNATTIIRVNGTQVPQQMIPDTVMAPGIVSLGVRINWR